MTFTPAVRALRSQLVYLYHRHGWPAAVGIGFFMAAIALQLWGVQTALDAVETLRAEQFARQSTLKNKPLQSTDKAAQAQTKRDAFVASLPLPAAALEAVDLIHQKAVQHHVQLATGQYRLVRSDTGSLLRYQMTLPAHAPYAQLRVWLAQVMNALPTAALDEVRFTRNAVDSDALDMEVRITFYMRAN